MAASASPAAVGLTCAAILVAACGGGEERAATAPPPAGVPAPPGEVAPAPPPELRPGGAPASADLAPGETHRYRLPLERGEFVRLAVEQYGIDAAVALASPGGEVLVEADRPVGGHGAELVLAVAERAGEYELTVRGGGASRPGRYAVRIDILRPATPRDRRAAAALLRHAAAAGLSGEARAERLAESLAAWRELGEAALEADAARHLAEDAFRRKDRAEAAARFRDVAEAYERGGERRPAARARLSLGDTLAAQTLAEKAVAEYRIALGLAEGLDDPALEARIHHGIGRALKNQGDLQSALDHYEAALRRFPAADRFRPYTLHELGVLLARYLGQEPRGRRLLRSALEAWPAESARLRAFTLNQLGQLAYERGEPEAARRHFEEALGPGAESEACDSAVTRARLALVEQAEGVPDAADRRLAEAAAALGGRSCPAQEATVSLLGATVAEERGDGEAARARYRRSLELYADWGDRVGQAQSLAGIARAERALGRPGPALAASGRALAILEGVRPTVLREDLRTSFFAGAQDVFDLHIGLLIAEGRAAEAWVVAERARAQALRDLLAEAGAGVRAAADPGLVVRERALQRRLNELEASRLGPVGETIGRDAAELRALGGRIDAAVAELERVRGEIRRRDPGAAAAPDPGAISLDELRGALEPGALLLEYRLGAAESHLWAVSGDAVEAFPLPARRAVEAAAREAVTGLRSLRFQTGRNPQAACELSAMLLGPVAGRLGGRALTVVPDGVLETVPFAALPDPAAGAAGCPGAPPLVTAHAIGHLPSVATLATQRRRLAGRRPAAGWLAVIADPVYDAADERLGPAGPAGDGAAGPDRARPAGGGREPAPPPLRRLPHAGAEAEAILAGLPAGKTLAKTGLEATREAVVDGDAGGYRILHLAAHGVLNAERPLLSFLALSRFDAGRRPVEGALYAHEVYGLDLAAELVVLSACDTALGPEVRGEALAAGLPRAFLYAGAERVLVSLWQVPDAGTGELMTGFYHHLIERGLPPAEALRQAQQGLIRAGRRPQQWAGFVLQGDPRPLSPFSD